MTKQLDAGDVLLARWLDERELTYEFEPQWGVSTCPDFRLSVFTEMQVGDHDFQPMSQALKPPRQKIRAAAQQLKPLADSSRPLVAAIATPDNRPVAFTA